ncbi:MAG: type III toxin-antitoxin system ToxN/AbiQ family toxin [Oscillospiraceae bacterium]|nr:type III toxin-antitoxin system ToxN/AbiQ family toxin [Oscillospiraceae bacterium]
MASADGTLAICKSIIPIIRMTTKDTMSGELELKGTLKLSNMIPVPPSELTPYDISLESDLSYRQIVLKEWDFIRSNKQMIMKNARVLYNQKTKCSTLLRGKSRPGTWTEQ